MTGPAMERIHRSPFATKDIGERFPIAADQRLKDTGRHPEDTKMAIPRVRSHEILEISLASPRSSLPMERTADRRLVKRNGDIEAAFTLPPANACLMEGLRATPPSFRPMAQARMRPAVSGQPGNKYSFSQEAGHEHPMSERHP